MDDWRKTTDEDMDEEEILLRNKCRNIDNDKLKKIIPIWTTNYYEMQLSTYHPNESNRVFVQCNLSKLIENSENLDNVIFNKHFNGFWPDESRFATTIERWINKEPVDPPVIEMGNKKTFKVVDGRHRTILAQYIGVEKITISIPRYLIEKAKALIDATIINIDDLQQKL